MRIQRRTGSPEERFRQIYILEENILHSISKLYVSFTSSLDVFSEWRCTHSEQRDHTVRQVVASKKFETMES